MKLIPHKRKSEHGAVSLFAVIFAALLITIITVSFIQLMVRDQQQATTSDLSQSAYDSAQAGVEDAKRLLLLDQECRSGAADANVDCNQVAQALTPANGATETACDTLAAAGLVGQTNGETRIESSEGDERLDQAYTCVKIATNTADYKGELTTGQSTVIPLRGTGSFDTVEVSWFSIDDLANPNNPTADIQASGGDIELPPVSEWGQNAPPLMRTQMIQTGGSFSLDQFDDIQDGKSNANTLFLYPTSTGLPGYGFDRDVRRSPQSAPLPLRCNQDLTTNEYACVATLRLPAPIDGNTGNRNAYLHLAALYNNAHYRIRLLQGATEVTFNNVQPLVDSTGRANDVFRRVQARVQLSSDYTYPQAVIDIEGDLCKNFTITGEDSGYTNSTTCSP